MSKFIPIKDIFPDYKFPASEIKPDFYIHICEKCGATFTDDLEYYDLCDPCRISSEKSLIL